MLPSVVKEFEFVHMCHVSAMLLKVLCFEDDFDTCGNVYQFKELEYGVTCFVHITLSI
jgi:hypothetical protein